MSTILRRRLPIALSVWRKDASIRLPSMQAMLSFSTGENNNFEYLITSSMPKVGTLHHRSSVLLHSSGAQQTMNGSGFEMSRPNPLLDAWTMSYDRKHPLVDIGAAYGRNTLAAISNLDCRFGPTSGEEIRVVAMDCDAAHLEIIGEKNIPGVKTMRCRLPDSCPTQVMLEAYGGACGILLSEVIHWLPGRAIMDSLSACYDMLVPGGLLAVTAMSPHFHLTDTCYKHIQRVMNKNRKAEYNWPGQGIDMQAALIENLVEAQIQGITPEMIRHIPTYAHFLSVETLTEACQASGFCVVLAQYADNPGYPHFKQGPNIKDRECTQILAFKS